MILFLVSGVCVVATRKIFLDRAPNLETLFRSQTFEAGALWSNSGKRPDATIITYSALYHVTVELAP